MDTDSAYIAFSCENPFQDCIKPELRAHFKEHKYDWFPRDYNIEVAKFDRRTPGLFKDEWSGDAMVSQSSKNYICYLPDESYKVKVSAKGIQQGGGRNNGVLNPNGFETVVQERITLQGTNKGFRLSKEIKSNITYTQTKTALNYYYDKRRLYYDPKTGFIGAQALYYKGKELNPKITFKIVKDWYSSQTDIQRFQEQKKRFNGFKIASHNPNSWQMDLAFWEKRPILTAININSRLGYAKLMSNKTAPTVLAALKAFVRLHKVDILTTDNGGEFMNSQAQAFYKSKKIEHYNNDPGDHGTMGKIERFNRTLKQRLTKMSPSRITQKVITDVIENYNTTFHRSIGVTPNEAKGKVMDAVLSHNQVEADRIKEEFEIGSSVLYRLKKQTFDKEAFRWSKAVYKIVGIDGSRVQIRSKNGHTLYKAPSDLKFVKTETTDAAINRGDILEAEKILEYKKMRSGKFKYFRLGGLVMSLTHDAQDNSRLINKNGCQPLRRRTIKMCPHCIEKDRELAKTRKRVNASDGDIADRTKQRLEDSFLFDNSTSTTSD
ncbi:unnamed protein product [Phytophthora lilii]|uniref:Unnamed protein product n=1 Tax=Phytophthora lilii TaxID=2077276 RepID=A0A9W6YKN6_9STRA|nr:unnamed protein product [Phytophthora lilii]